MADLYELPAIAGIYVLIGILFVVAYTFTLLAHALNVSVFGTHPFSGLANAIENTIVNGCKSGINDLEHWATRFESALIDTLGLLLGVFLLPLLGIRAALGYLWHQLVKPLVKDATSTAREGGSAALAKVTALEKTVSNNLTRAENFTTAHISALRTEVISYATQEADSIETDLRREVKAIRDLIPQAVKDAANATDVITAPILTTINNAENAALNALEQAGTKTIGELQAELGRLDLTQLTALIGSIPLLAALVQTVTAESGLDSANCRSKVKGICSTDGDLWGNLVSGLIALDVAFNLRELVELGNEMIGDLTPLIQEIEL